MDIISEVMGVVFVDVVACIDKLKESLICFDSKYDNQRKMFMDMTINRFLRRLEVFNNSKNFIKVESFQCECGVLNINKNIYYMMQQLYKDFQERHVNYMVNAFEELGVQCEKSLVDTVFQYIQLAVDQNGGVESARRAAEKNGVCYISLDRIIMEAWVTSEIAGYVKIFMILMNGNNISDDEFQSGYSLMTDFINKSKSSDKICNVKVIE